jgi:hypothetical protein
MRRTQMSPDDCLISFCRRPGPMFYRFHVGAGVAASVHFISASAIFTFSWGIMVAR